MKRPQILAVAIAAAVVALGSAVPTAAVFAATSTKAPSSSSSPVITNVVKPTIAGATPFQYGETVAVTPGTWSTTGKALTTFTYQWYEGGKAVSGATSFMHKIGLAGANSKSIKVKVTAHSSHYTAGSATSDVETVRVASFNELTPLVVVPAAKPAVGVLLTANLAALTPVPASLTYQWYRDGLPITGAVHTSHTLVAADCNRQLTLLATASSPGYETFKPIANYSDAVC